MCQQCETEQGYINIAEARQQLIDNISYAPDNRKILNLEARFEQRLFEAFTSAKKAFPYSEVEDHIKAQVSTESEVITEADLVSELNQILSFWLKETEPEIYKVLQDNIKEGYDAGFAGSLLDMAQLFGVKLPKDYLPTNPLSVEFAKKAISKAKLSKSTIKMIGEKIAFGLENQMNTQQIAKLIRDSVEESLSRERATLIARTEMANSTSAGAYEQNKAVGATEKTWTALGDGCEYCLSNEAQSWIQIDEAFTSGSMYPAQHPRCRCVVTYRGVSKDKVKDLLGM